MKKQSLLFVLLLISMQGLFAQGTSINTTGALPDASAILDVSSTAQGMLIPRMTNGQRDAISNPAPGLMILNTSTGCVNLYQTPYWFEMCPNCIQPSTPSITHNGPLCAGETLNLSTGAVSGATYSWTGPNGFSSALQNPSIPNATTAAGGTYTLTIEVNSCVSDAATTTVTVNAKPVADAGSDVTIVNGQSTTLTASGGSSYSWSSGDNTASASVSPTSTTTYTVTVTDGNGCTDTDDVTVTVVNLQVGDSYGGGIVFFVNGSSGLVAASTDQSSSAEWGCFGGNSNAFSDTDGQTNTTSIVSACSQSSIAARICDNLSLNGYTDWYLPAKSQLNTLYGQKNTVGGFSNAIYWSSTEYNINLAWYQDFTNGTQHYYNNIRKYDPQRVRCIRSY